jgi:hypothetical protein
VYVFTPKKIILSVPTKRKLKKALFKNIFYFSCDVYLSFVGHGGLRIAEENFKNTPKQYSNSGFV